MKLKRILSLALSGVLAVSLMTGCFGGGGKSDAVNRSWRRWLVPSMVL